MMPLKDFTRLWGRLSFMLPVVYEESMKAVGEIVAGRARGKLGEYQSAVGPFPAWAPLAQSTIDRKGGQDTPLIDTGQFLHDISYSVTSPFSVEIGTNQKYIIYTEYGTPRMPPRLVFGPAAIEKIGEIEAIVGSVWIETFARGLGRGRARR